MSKAKTPLDQARDDLFETASTCARMGITRADALIIVVEAFDDIKFPKVDVIEEPIVGRCSRCGRNTAFDFEDENGKPLSACCSSYMVPEEPAEPDPAWLDSPW
jgi:hypothetical protein